MNRPHTKPGDLSMGDVVQLDPDVHMKNNGFFAGCFMLVTEVKLFGAQGFICMPGGRGTVPGRAYYRAKWEEMVKIGTAEWMSADDAPDEDPGSATP